MRRVRLVAAVVLAMTASSLTLGAEPPPILQITIEGIAPGKEAEYGVIEEDLAKLCARLDCPNNYLALLSLDAPQEVWWFVSYDSQADVERVAAGYASNRPLLEAMRALAARKSGFAAQPVEHWTKLRADLSDAVSWAIGTTRFAVIATLASGGGTVFETADERYFTILTANKRAEATAAAVRLGADARVFEVRPSWSRPAADWTIASPDIWTLP